MRHLISVVGGLIGMIGASLWLGGIAFLLNLIVAPNGLYALFTWVPANGWLRLAIGLVAIFGGLKVMNVSAQLPSWVDEQKRLADRRKWLADKRKQGGL